MLLKNNLTTLPGRSHIQVIKKELVIIMKRRYNNEHEKLKCNKAAQSRQIINNNYHVTTVSRNSKIQEKYSSEIKRRTFLKVEAFS